MNGILDNSLVGLALLAAAAYAVASLGPRSLRKRMLDALGRMAARAPAVLGLRRAAQWLIAASSGKSQGACGGCDGCGSSSHAAVAKPVDGVVSVPVAKIGLRSKGHARTAQE